MVKPFIVGSDSAKNFLHFGTQILKKKGRALDAVEETCKAVESNPEDHGVGLGGVPNLLGKVALDASIMMAGPWPLAPWPASKATCMSYPWPGR
jgi:beta-aspartyl-peptidase (threonine type)